MCTCLLGSRGIALGQKGNHSKQDERRENERVAREALLDDVEQVGNDHDDKLKPLQKLISKPMELENEFIARDSTASEAMKHLSQQQAELDRKRKLLPSGEVEKDRKVVQALSDVTKKEKEIGEIEGKLKKMKAEAGQIQKRFVGAQMSLQKAKVADAADPNRPGQKNGR